MSGWVLTCTINASSHCATLWSILCVCIDIVCICANCIASLLIQSFPTDLYLILWVVPWSQSLFSHMNSLGVVHQQKFHVVLSTSFSSMFSPAKYGHLGVFHFCALPPTSVTFCTLEVIVMVPDEPGGVVLD